MISRDGMMFYPYLAKIQFFSNIYIMELLGLYKRLRSLQFGVYFVEIVLKQLPGLLPKARH